MFQGLSVIRNDFIKFKIISDSKQLFYSSPLYK